MRLENLLAIGALASSAFVIQSFDNPDSGRAGGRRQLSASSIVVYSTRLHTITACDASVTNCPVLTSIVDATTTICPVTQSVAVSVTALPVPSGTSAGTFTKTSTGSAHASSVPSRLLGSTLVSPQQTSKEETTVRMSTLFVYSTVTHAANESSTTSGPAFSANSTVVLTTALGNSSFSSNAIGPATATATRSFSMSANGTLPNATVPGTAPVESIVPYTGEVAANAVDSLLLAAAVLAAYAFLG